MGSTPIIQVMDHDFLLKPHASVTRWPPMDAKALHDLAKRAVRSQLMPKKNPWCCNPVGFPTSAMGFTPPDSLT